MSKNLVNKVSGKADKKIVYRIEKEFSINNIEQIKNEIDEIVKKSETFMLELKNIDSFDLSAIQLLNALKFKMKDAFQLSIELKDDVKTIIEHAGFNNLLN